MVSRIGIWLDYKRAIIMILDPSPSTISVDSMIETNVPKGGSGSVTPYGPMDKVSESAFLSRRKQQESTFYRRIIAKIEHASAIYIFGPGMAKQGLLKSIKSHKGFNPDVVKMETADLMTPAQMMAKTLDFFNETPARRFPSNK